MQVMRLITGILLTTLLITGSHAKDWTYANKSDWGNATKTCVGRKQSPINLGENISTLDTIPIYEFDQKLQRGSLYKMTLINTGYSLKIDMRVTILMGVKNSLMYEGAQIHFHWGKSNNRGSEHTVDNTAFPMEGHFVFWNKKAYKDFSTSVGSPYGLAVLGVMYKLGAEDNPLLKALEPKLKPIFNNSQNKLNISINTTTNPSFDLVKLFLPKNQSSFYRYEGGLTTPPCYESVIWTVYKEPVRISQRQLNLLRGMMSPGSKKKLGDNYRDPQPLNADNIPGVKRIIYRTFGEPSGAAVLKVSPAASFTLIAVFTAAMAITN